MVRILTEDFIELDLAPGYEFQIEMSNPMFDSGHLPETFSTQIPFPPSPTNRDKFGYTPVLMRPPGIQMLAASIWIGGVPFMYGTLVYDGIDDGALLYTFTCKIPDLEAKIWDQALLEFTTDNIPDGSSNFFKTPLVIRSDNVAMQPYLNGPVDDNLWVKYWNYKTTGKSFDYDSFLPAIPVSVIIGWLGLETSIDLRYLLESIVVLGRFHEFAASDVVIGSSAIKAAREGSRVSYSTSISRQRTSSYDSAETSSSGSVSGRSSRRQSKKTDLASFLPDITFAKLLQGLGSMLCSSFYVKNGTLIMIRNAAVLDAEPMDWRGKVSDDFSCEVTEASSYKFGYGTEDENQSRPSVNSRSCHFVKAGSENNFDPSVILSAISDSGLYSLIWDETTGDLYSGRSYLFGKDAADVPAGYSAPRVFDCDVVYQNAKAISSEVEDEDSSSFDNTCDFELVKCVPEKIFPNTGAGSWPEESDATYRMTPVVVPLQTAAQRDNKVYIGVIDNLYQQMTDHDMFLPKVASEGTLLGRNSLTPQDLWKAHHESYAKWMSRRRQTVKADINFSPSDLSNFNIYTPVYFAARKWVVKTLTITFAAGQENVSASGVFVEI